MLWALGCGAPGSGFPPSTTSDMAVAPDMVASSYPAGPYGQPGNVNPGDVLPNFTFQGFPNFTATTGLSSAQPFGAVTFADLHNSGAKYALLELGAFW